MAATITNKEIFNLNVPGCYSQFGQEYEVTGTPEEVEKECASIREKAMATYAAEAPKIKALVDGAETATQEKMRIMAEEKKNLSDRIAAALLFHKSLEALGFVDSEKTAAAKAHMEATPEYKKLYGNKE